MIEIDTPAKGWVSNWKRAVGCVSSREKIQKKKTWRKGENNWILGIIIIYIYREKERLEFYYSQWLNELLFTGVNKGERHININIQMK